MQNGDRQDSEVFLLQLQWLGTRGERSVSETGREGNCVNECLLVLAIAAETSQNWCRVQGSQKTKKRGRYREEWGVGGTPYCDSALKNPT